MFGNVLLGPQILGNSKLNTSSKYKEITWPHPFGIHLAQT